MALELDRALSSGEQVTASYTRPVRTAGLWDAAGNQIADFSGVRVANGATNAPAPSVSDGRAAEGEAVEFTVSRLSPFASATASVVAVSVSPTRASPARPSPPRCPARAPFAFQ